MRKNNQSFFYYVFFTSVFFVVGFISLSSKQSTVRCANSLSCAESLKLKIENNVPGVFENRPVMPPVIFPDDTEIQNVLGETTISKTKHIFVDLGEQKVYAFEGKELFMDASISSGKWGRTPKGEFTVWTKIRSTRMRGGEGADYYNLPNVPYVMFFANREVPAAAGFSFHGAYWHNNFGYPMSHGCINMKETDAKKLYEWADTKIKVTIYGDPPA